MCARIATWSAITKRNVLLEIPSFMRCAHASAAIIAIHEKTLHVFKAPGTPSVSIAVCTQIALSIQCLNRENFHDIVTFAARLRNP